MESPWVIVRCLAEECQCATSSNINIMLARFYAACIGENVECDPRFIVHNNRVSHEQTKSLVDNDLNWRDAIFEASNHVDEYNPSEYTRDLCRDICNSFDIESHNSLEDMVVELLIKGSNFNDIFSEIR